MKDLNQPRFAEGDVHSTVNVMILEHLKANGASFAIDIDQVLMRVDGYCDDSGLARLTRALLKMSQRRMVHRLDTVNGQCWVLGPRPIVKAEPNDPNRVPAARISMMHGAIYRPTPSPVQRPGSDDHARLPSLRQGQRVPFVPGYIFY